MRVFERTILSSARESEEYRNFLSSFGSQEETVLMDIETTGFSRRYETVYLTGMASFTGDGWKLRQFLCEQIEDERELIEQTFHSLLPFKTVVTYNGDAFDLPFLEERARRFHLWNKRYEDWVKNVRSLDLLKQYRRYQTFFGWPDMKLKTLEGCLDIGRQDPFSGGQLIDLFFEYTKTDDERLEKTLLLHNDEDIVNLKDLFKVERFMNELRTGRVLELSLSGDCLTVTFDDPLSFSHEGKGSFTGRRLKEGEETFTIRTKADETDWTIRLPYREEGLRYFLPHPGDYYYLPRTNEIVHKSLAEGIPASEREKAGVQRACLPAPAGRYLRMMPLQGARQYRTSYKDKAVYYEEAEASKVIRNMNEEERTAYVRSYIGQIG